MECYYDMAILLGIILGMFIMLLLLLFIDRINWLDFKKYLLKCNDEKKEKIKESLDKIKTEFENISNLTNILTFKKKTNNFLDFLNYLRKYWLN